MALMVAVLGAVAAGCGSEEESLSKAEYIKQGDATCKKGNARLLKAAKAFGDLGPSKPKPAKVEAYTRDTLVPVIRSQIEDLRALSAPEGDADRLDKLYDEAEKALDEVEADPMVVLRVTNPFAEASKQAKDYGFKECVLRLGSS